MTSLYLIINSGSFFEDSLGFSTYEIMSVDRDHFASSSAIYMPFIYFRHPCLAPDLRVTAFRFFTIQYDISCKFFVVALYLVEEVPFCF